MVKGLGLAFFLLLSVPAVSQTISVGGRLGFGLGSSVSLESPRDYYIQSSDRDKIRTSGKGYMELDPFTPPEFYIRYTARNRFFVEIAGAFAALKQNTFYGLDPETEEQYNPYGRGERDTFWGIIPEDHMGVRVFYFTPNVTVQYFLTKGTVIKPYVGLGISPSFMQSNVFMHLDPFLEEVDDPESIILKDFGERKPMVLNGKATFGMQYYSFHMQLHALTNLGAIDQSADSYHKRFTSFYFSFGYNLLNINLTKKSRL